jgi:hypothetical protein
MPSEKISFTNNLIRKGRHDIQHNDTLQYNTRRNVILNVAFFIIELGCVVLSSILLSVFSLNVSILSVIMVRVIILPYYAENHYNVFRYA